MEDDDKKFYNVNEFYVGGIYIVCVYNYFI